MSTTSADRRDITRAFVLSVASVCWTVVSSTLAVAIGISTHVAVLVAFGAVGIVDAVGSVSLAYHFHHARRHDQLSARLEAISHRIVLVGLTLVGISSVVGGILRLGASSKSDAGVAGLVLAAASTLVLTLLSIGKQRVAQRIGSDALRSDGHLSGIGAVLGAVTLVGTAATHWFGWSWVDGVATILVGIGALGLARSSSGSVQSGLIER
jgi:divalent metal cation (Fe/Co/Zn/Cd) transporter